MGEGGREDKGVFLFYGTHGSEDPTKAVIPFLSANAACDEGFEAEVFLIGDAVDIIKESVIDKVVPVAWPPLKEILATTVKHRIPLYV